MPQIFKRAGSPYYYARWQQGGKDFVISTKCSSKREAMAELDRKMRASMGDLSVEDEYKRLELALGLMPENERDGKRQEIAKRLLAGQNAKLSLADGWQTWLASPNKKRTPKQTTISGYKAIWTRFIQWSETQAIGYFHDMDEKRSKAYAADLWKSKISPATFNAHIKFLMSVFKVLETEAGLTENSWRKVTHRDKTPDQGRRAFTPDEIQTIFSRAQGGMKVMLGIGLFTGLRLADVVHLRWDEIDNDRFTNAPRSGFLVVLPVKVSRMGKEKKVEIPIHSELRKVLELHRKTKSNQYLFPDEQELYDENPSAVTEPIQEFFKSCGITTTEKSENGERRRAIVRVGFHSLRHSFVSMCAKSGAPLHVVQKLVGHGSPAMTEHYTHLDDAQKCDAISKLPEIKP